MTSYFVRREGEETGCCDFVLHVGKNLITGEGDFSKQFGEVDSLEADLLLLGASVFAAGRASPRGEREDLGRRIEINVPVVNLEKFLLNAQNIELLLRILSNDSWGVSFRASSHSQPAKKIDRPESDSKTLLFSGGLDSLAAAIDLSDQASPLQLVSHITQNQSTSRAESAASAKNKKDRVR